MNFRRYQNEKKPQFMIIPLIDVIFFLLVFFMMNSMQTVTQRVMSVQLPQAATAAAPSQLPVIVTVDSTGHIMVDSRSMSYDEVSAFLHEKLRVNPQAAVVLQADKQAAHGQVVAVMDIMKKAGVQKLGIAAEKKG
ncbi:MAG: biopolymer transporter ExbD [Selenomonadaceae bacterium]|nr:biopolymer transporter ExbD [Selenomonadaceae bacterium]